MRKILCALIVISLLTGCHKAQESVQEQTSSSTTSMESFDNSYYKIVNIESQGSELREEFYLRYGSQNDFKTIGRGLQILSSDFFSTSNHYMSEGRYIPLGIFEEEMKKRDTQYSLQPKKGTILDGVQDPVMVRTLQEQDYYVKEGKKYVLKGLSIAVVLDPRNTDGSALENPMSTQTIEKYGYEVVDKLYNVIQTHEEFENIKDLPILIAVYSATDTSSSTINGKYILESYCQNEVGQIKELNYENVLFTSEYAEQLDKTTYSEFVTIKTALKNTATEAAGLVGEARYRNGEIESMVMTANLNVKTYTELLNLTALIADGIDTKFTYDFDCKVLVKSQDELQAVIIKTKGQKAKSYDLY